MNTKKRTILIPYDFTELSQYSIEYASYIAKKFKDRITLLHIVESLDQEKEVTDKLNLIAEEVYQKYKIRTDVKDNAAISYCISATTF